MIFNALGKFIVVSFVVLLISNMIAIPGNIIHHGVADKYKVSGKLTSGKEFTGYITKENYIEYLYDADLILTNRTINHDDVYYVNQAYNPYGTKEVNQTIISD